MIVACGGAEMVDQMFGSYRLEGLIGRGGMGEVHRAFDTHRHRTVALKILRSELGDDDGFRDRFRREARLAARLQEPHILPIHDFGEIDGALFIDMRLVHGRDASDALGRDGPMPVRLAVAVIAQVAAALDAAHTEGVVHRDVKPSNVLLTPAGFAYLVDFGIARAVLDGATALTATGSAVGTMLYMAPEQFEGTRIDGRVDVYALACMFHELITGETPFRPGPLPAIMHAHLNLPPPRASTIRPGIPPALDAVIACGMAKNPVDRFPTAGEFARAAEEQLDRLSSTPTTLTPSARASATPNRRRALLLGAAALATVAATVGVTLTATSASGPPGAAAPSPSNTTAAPTSTGPSRTPAPSGGTLLTAPDLTPAELALAELLDPQVVRLCSRSSEMQPPAVVAQLACTARETGPTTNLTVRQFGNGSDMIRYFDAEASRSATGPGPDAATNCRAGQLVDAWTESRNGTTYSGTVVCRPGVNSVLRIAWTLDDQLVIVLGGGNPEFHDWWALNKAVVR